MQIIIIPGIIVGLIGGILLFFAAYNFYPHKNVNINLDGDCYEFLGNAYTMYKNLENIKERELLKMQIQAIENPDVPIPIAFSGPQSQVNTLIDTGKINVTNRQTLGDNQTSVDKVIVKGLGKLSFLQEYYDDWNINSTDDTEVQSLKIGILPNKFISAQESASIKSKMDKFMIQGIKDILATKDGVKSTECRSAIVYQDGG
ncbi:hypothetical protein [Candidatus Nitrosocosmicus sp. SS]|uniref:hypothetical protein n=1 Tax=Candidatus Nitrosocosmicus agrestis TaxID=2563600 RepID=UPI00122E0D04|nr:hypothetical protein [Candidatus Nitrosocosmicus sp. SS]KAA2280214.1 hypothetical protein F1Z66_11455 [Candidatus Nitrosocosmicus sp. SS]KAF0869529.1 hypothetical protein E5N71_04690 [Candidatus Nitrosocosmicus sp. SS]